jgi:hypothetical protein
MVDMLGSRVGGGGFAARGDAVRGGACYFSTKAFSIT